MSLHIWHASRRRLWTQNCRPPQSRHRCLGFLCSQKSRDAKLSTHIGRPCACHPTRFPNRFRQAEWPCAGTSTWAFPVPGCRQNQVLVIVSVHLEQLSWTVCSEQKTLSKVFIFLLGWYTPLDETAISARFLCSFSNLSEEVAKPNCLAWIKSYSRCHSLPALVDSVIFSRADSLFPTSNFWSNWAMYIKAISTAWCVMKSVKSKWLNAEINNCLTLGCKAV